MEIRVSVGLTFAASCAAGVLFFLLVMVLGLGPAHSLIGTASAAPASQLPVATQLTASAAPPVYFADDFDDGNADGWTTLGGGRWTVENQAYVFRETTQDDTVGVAVAGEAGWRDYRFAVDLSTGAFQDMTLLVRYHGEGDHYALDMIRFSGHMDQGQATT